MFCCIRKKGAVNPDLTWPDLTWPERLCPFWCITVNPFRNNTKLYNQPNVLYHIFIINVCQFVTFYIFLLFFIKRRIKFKKTDNRTKQKNHLSVILFEQLQGKCHNSIFLLVHFCIQMYSRSYSKSHFTNIKNHVFMRFWRMPVMGLEPIRGCPQQILSLPRLPIPTHRLMHLLTTMQNIP